MVCYTDTFPAPNPGDDDYTDQGLAQESGPLPVTKHHTLRCISVIEFLTAV